MRRRVTCLLGGLAAALALTGCGDDTAASRDAPTLSVDPSAGTVGAVALGDRAAAVRQALGSPAPAQAARPTSKVGLPWVIVAPEGRPRGDRAEVLSYDDMYLLSRRDTGVYAVAVWRPGTKTTNGIALGDPLDRARERYPGLKCAVRNRTGEHPSYPYCRGRVDGHWVWFGHDPIHSITLSTTKPG
jgi:hypothetical protein